MTAFAGCFSPFPAAIARRGARCSIPRPSNPTAPAWSATRRVNLGWDSMAGFRQVGTRSTIADSQPTRNREAGL